jgi:DNA polymerase (family 10)
MRNREVADLLFKIADGLDLSGENFFKIRAYRKAGNVIKDLPEDIEKIYKDGNLTTIEGVGSGIAKKIEEYLTTGKMTKLEEVTKDVPESLFNLLNIRDLGPRTIHLLHKKLGVNDLQDLRKVIQDGSFSEIEGLGDKKAEKILENIKFYEERTGKDRRFTIGEVMPMVEKILANLEKSKSVKRFSTAGSLRRMKETVGDIDILIETAQPEKAIKEFTSFPEIKKVLEAGKTKVSVMLKDIDILMDLRILPRESYGAALLYFTGSKDHNVKLRGMAIKKGLKINEYGVFKKEKMVAGKTEKEIYNLLGMDFIPPELRENRGEIELALKGELPDLINYNDIKGNLHTHTKYSDGKNSIKELASFAKDFGYSYIGITDHSSQAAYANGLKEDELKKQIDEIDALNENLKDFRILKGTESDILPDGSLDFKDELLEKLDFVIGAIHSGFKKNVTSRMEKALENPYLTILAHPTGRLISSRVGYEVDLEKVMEKAKEKKKILEINAYYDRLDLNEFNAREANEKGIKLCISTDAHNFDMFKWMNLGVGIARRAWIPSNSVINTYVLADLLNTFKRNG